MPDPLLEQDCALAAYPSTVFLFRRRRHNHRTDTRFIAAVSSRVITAATPVSRAGHAAPTIQADWWPIALPARGIAALLSDIAGPPLLSNPRLVLAPDFKPLGFRMRLRDFRQAGSKPLI